MGPIQGQVNSLIHQTAGLTGISKVSEGIEKQAAAQEAEVKKVDLLKQQTAAATLKAKQAAITSSKMNVAQRYQYLKKGAKNLGGFGNIGQANLENITTTYDEAIAAGLKGTDKELKALDQIKENQMTKLRLEEELDGGKK